MPNYDLSSEFQAEYPDFDKKPERVKCKFENLATKVNLFWMLGHSSGTYVEVMDLTDAIFKNLTLSDYSRELLTLLIGAYADAGYEWDQHVITAEASGVSEDQIIAISEQRIDDSSLFSEADISLLRFGFAILKKGKASAILMRRALAQFSMEEISDAFVVVGFYMMLSNFVQTLNIPSDPPEDGSWIKK
jgi:alkylhydroperoxidase family enzyme